MRELLTVEEYLAEVLALAEPDRRAEELPLDGALGRVLAIEWRSQINIPGFANSAMDGYAVRFAEVADAPVTLTVAGEVPAGSAADPEAAPGEVVRIMTGAPLPGFADTVVPVEDTDGGTDLVRIEKPPARKGAHVRGVGEDISAGDPVTPAGSVLTPGVIGALAASGAGRVSVRPRPVVAVAATGDELVSGGAPLGRGQIHDSNSLALAASLTRDGAEVLRGRPLVDRPDAVVAWLDEVLAGGADLAVLTGGASVGAYDVVRDVLAPVGAFRHVRVQPGKPQGWGRWRGTLPVICLPGNPLSAVLSYELFVRPWLDRRLGRPGPPWLTASAAAAWTSPPGRRQLVPVRLTTTDGRLQATPAHRRGSASHVITSLATADGFAAVPEEVTAVAEGDLLAVRRL